MMENTMMFIIADNIRNCFNNDVENNFVEGNKIELKIFFIYYFLI
jgi:hypothetical protein